MICPTCGTRIGQTDIAPPRTAHGKDRTPDQLTVSQVLEIVNGAPARIWIAAHVQHALRGIVPLAMVTAALEHLAVGEFIARVRRGQYRAVGGE